MRFSEIARRLTGISTPIFGVSWEPGEADVAVARRVVRFLEDRRVLFNPYELEVPAHCIESVIEIRRFLTDQINTLADDDDVVPHLVAMRTACRKFLDSIDEPERRGLLHPGNMWGSPGWVFNSALGELRGVIGVHVAQLAAKHGLDVAEGLDSILPAEPASDDDRDDRW